MEVTQAFSQISTMVKAAGTDQVLSMDTMTDETDPSMAIGVARLHLEEAREQALDLYKSLHAAHQPTAHIISDGDPRHPRLRRRAREQRLVTHAE